MKAILNRCVVLCLAMGAVGASLFAQASEEASREKYKNLVIKEYKMNVKDRKPELDEEIRYDARGNKVESIEYYSNQEIKYRTVYEYDENDLCVKEVLYDDRNKAVRIRKIEYNDDRTKKVHYNYYPNGRLYSTKQYEYSYQ